MTEFSHAAPERNLKDAAIRCLIVPLDGCSLMIPNVLVSEVAPFQVPAPMNAPEWVLGRIQWRGLIVPLVSVERLLGLPGGRPERMSRAIVLNTLNGDARMPFIAVLSRGIPRMQSVVMGMLPATAEGDADGVLCRFELNGETMMIPDLDRIEQSLLRAGLVVGRADMTTEKV
ncbi:MAG: chemotaxis protein CheW [Thiohalomonadaceae bacterium]